MVVDASGQATHIVPVCSGNEGSYWDHGQIHRAHTFDLGHEPPLDPAGSDAEVDRRGISLRWLPTQGYRSPFDDVWGFVRHMTLPTVALSSTAVGGSSSALTVMAPPAVTVPSTLARTAPWISASVSDFSGSVFVISLKSETVWNRRPALVGLRLRSAMSF